MTILIVEDELLITLEIKSILNELNYFDILQAKNYSEAIELIEKEKPDLALIDINLSGQKTGIDIALHVKKTNPFPFIFLTSISDQTTIDTALKSVPAAYLIKPVNKITLYASIELAFSKFAKEELVINDGIFIKDKEAFVKVMLDDIFYFKSTGNYVDVFTDRKTYVIRSTLSSLLDGFLPTNFIRIHKSFLINIKKATGFNNENVTMLDSKSIPIGENYKTTFHKLIKKI
jgi:two-component system, LytTR family, response regulator LytT